MSSNTLSNSELSRHRKLLLLGSFIYSAWWLVFHLMAPSTYDSLSERLGISVVMIVAVAVSYLNDFIRERFDVVFKICASILSLHYFWIMYINHLDVPHAIGAFVVVFSVCGCFIVLRDFVQYSILILGISAYIAITADQSIDIRSILLLGLSTALLINYLALYDRLKVFAEEKKAKLELQATVDLLKLSEERLTAANRNLRETQEQLTLLQKVEAMGQLASGIAHDFNNILASIRVYTELLIVRYHHDVDALHELEAIESAALRGAEFTKKILTYARKQQQEIKLVNLNEPIIETALLLERTTQGLIHIERRLELNLNPIKGDNGQIMQVLMNLAVNARDAMPEGGILSFETENVHMAEPKTVGKQTLKAGNYVRLSVSDTGSGIDPKIVGKIFDPFFTTKEQGKGTGLGLSVVYGIVTSHGGEINVHSDPGKGTRFDIFLPAEVRNPKSDVNEALSAKGAKSWPEGGFTGQRLLIVDDDQAIRSALMDAVKLGGGTSISASNGEEAIEKVNLHANEIDAIVMDLQMPKLSGISAYKEIRKKAPGLPMILCSAFSGAFQVEVLMQDPKARFLEKPFGIETLVKVLEEIRS